MQTLQLTHGTDIPVIGFGTWEIKPLTKAKEMVLAALESGYRHIDTARIYGNEAGVGQALAETDIHREQLFITTKVWNEDQGYTRTVEACKASLERLGLQYLDLYLIHWPATKLRYESWKAFEKLHNTGVIKAAGVSNFTIEHLEDLKEQNDFRPAVNQVEFHPFIYEQQKPLLEYCREHDIVVEAYSPISRLANTDNKTISEIADRLERTPQQIVLRWCIQHGTVPLPRSTSAMHVASNFEVFDFELSDADMKALNSISDGERVTWDPAGMG